jgi:DNA-binding NarL/FixJ family response regulator
MNTLKVLLVGDYDRMRSSLASFLHKQDGVEIVGEAASEPQAVTLSETMQPDLVLMDIGMNGRSGYEATREIKRRAPHTRVIILSMHGGEIYRRMAWRFAADGFIDKSSIKRDLLAVLGAEQGKSGAAAMAATA